jgi:glutathione S-transferase
MKIRQLKLYHYPATRSARVKWMLHEVVGDAFEVARVDLYGGSQYSAEFMQLNPNHCVPVLVITWDTGESQRMIESAAIVTFLADSYPDKALAPPPGASPERVDYLQMLHFGSTWMDMMLWQVRIHEHVLPPAERDPRSVMRYRKKFTEEVEPQLARRLEVTP